MDAVNGPLWESSVISESQFLLAYLFNKDSIVPRDNMDKESVVGERK